MNKNLHRIIFNAARGMRMVVQETARSAGKASGASSALVGGALAALLATPLAHGQISGAANVPGNLRPTVLTAPNGVPLVNITTPSAAGVSRNVYNQFNVGANGAILNNSRTAVTTQLGGTVAGNPWLVKGPARIILNEVNGGNPSQLHGYLEVGGQRAEVVIANPAGIQVNGGGFINASRATLTTGTPQLNAMGGLDGFLVRGGTITIDGTGLDARGTDYAAILARALRVNAGIWASELKVVTGANQVSADLGQISATGGNEAPPAFAIDVAQLGGMYAGKITLIGTEAGVGARNAGTIMASTAAGASSLGGVGQLVVTSAGWLENTGSLQAETEARLKATQVANSGSIASGTRLKIDSEGDLANVLSGAGGKLEAPRLELASAGGDIDNRGGTIRQTSGSALKLDAGILSNRSGEIGPERAGASSGTGSTGAGSAATTDGTGGGDAHAGTGGDHGGGGAPAAPLAPPAPGVLHAAGALRNDGGRIFAGGTVELQVPQIDNHAGRLSVDSIAATGASFDNAGGHLEVSRGFTAEVGRFDNTDGSLQANSLRIAATGDLINQGGRLQSDTDAVLQADGRIDNDDGSVSAVEALRADAGAALNNAGGTLLANQTVNVSAASLDNSQGVLRSNRAGTQVSVAAGLNNLAGTMAAAIDLAVQAGSLDSSGTLRAAGHASVDVAGAMRNDGKIIAGGDATITAASLLSSSASVLGAGVQDDGNLGGTGRLTVTTSQALAAHGMNLAAGDAALQGASVDVSGSESSAARMALTATQGDITTSRAAMAITGDLTVRAAQAMVNESGQLSAGGLDIQAARLSNSGRIVQTGGGTTDIAIAGTLDNSGGQLGTNGQDLRLSAGSLSNSGGRIDHAGSGNFKLALGDLDGGNGIIASNGALTAGAANWNQDGGSLTAARIDLAADALSNQGGRIDQTGGGDTRIEINGDISNAGGRIASNGGGFSLSAGQLDNASGAIEHAGSGVFGLAVQDYDGSGGSIASNGNLAAQASGRWTQSGGSLTAVQLSLRAASIGNQSGSIVQTGTGDTRIEAGGGIDNSQGFIGSNGQNMALAAARLVNTNGQIVHAGSGHLTLDAPDYSGQGGRIASNGALAIRADEFDHDGASLTAGQLSIEVGKLSNRQGEILQTGTGSTRIAVAQVLDNSGGRIASNATDMTLAATTVINAAGRLEHAGSGSFSLAATTVESSAGQILSNGALTLDADGFVQDQGVTSARQLAIDVQSLSNRGGTIVQTGQDQTRIAVAEVLDNTDGVIASNGADVNLQAATLVNTDGQIQHAGSGTLRLAADTFDGSRGGIASNGALVAKVGNFNQDGGTLNAQQVSIDARSLSNQGGQIVQVGEGATHISVAGTLANVNGILQSNGTNVNLQAGTFDNMDGQVLHAGKGTLSLTVDQSFSGTGGAILGNGAVVLEGGDFNQDQGRIGAQQVSIDARSLSNRDGQIVQAGKGRTHIAVSGTLDNTDGLIASNGDDAELQAATFINVDGAIQHAGGGTLSLAADSFDGNRGSLASNGALVVEAGSFNQDGGGILAQQVTVDAASLSNRGGAIVQLGSGTTRIAVAGTLDNSHGSIASNGEAASLQANDFINAGGWVQHAGTGTLGLTAVDRFSGDGGVVVSNGALVMKGGDFSQDQGFIGAEQITLDTRSLSSRGGQITQVGEGSTRIAVAEALDNSGGTISSNGVDVDLKAAIFSNTEGKIEHAGSGTLSLAADNFDGNEGGIASNGALVAKAGSFRQDGGTLNAQQVSIDARSLSNQGGKIVQVGEGATRIAAAGILNNADGSIASNGADVSLQAGSLINAGGQIQHAGAGTLGISVDDRFSGSKGSVISNGALVMKGGDFSQDQGRIGAQQITIDARSLSNQGGTITQVGEGNTRIVVANALDNTAGAISSNGVDVELSALTFINTEGAIEHAGNGTLSLAADTFDGNKGSIASNGALAAKLGSFSQDGGTMSAQQVSIDARSLSSKGGKIVQVGEGATRIAVAGTLNNADGSISSNGADVSLQAGSFINAGGQIQHAGAGTLGISVDDRFSGNQGTIVSNGALVMKGGDFSQDHGRIGAQQITIDARSLSSRGGEIVQVGEGDTHIAVADALDNSGGAISSNGVNVDLKAATLGNTDGTIEHAGSGTMSLAADVFNGSQGSLASNGALVAKVGSFNQDGGSILAQQIRIDAASLSNETGKIVQLGEGATHIAASEILNNVRGTISSNGADMSLEAGRFLNTEGQVQHAGKGTLSIAAVDSFNGTKGTVVGNGALLMKGGDFSQDQGRIGAQQITVDARSLSNQGGTITQAGQGDTRIAVANMLDNSGGAISSNGGDMDLKAATFGNTEGTIEHAGSGTLSLAADSFDGNQGSIASNGALVAKAGSFSQDGGTLSAKQVSIDARSLSNQGGQIVQSGEGATRIAVSGALNNNGGSIATNGAALELSGGRFTNDNGKIAHAGTGILSLAAGNFSGGGSQIVSNGTLAVQAASFAQDNGSLTAVQVGIQAGALSNRGGQIIQTGSGDTVVAVTGGTLDNTQGVIATNGQNLSVSAGQLSNGGGRIEHAGDGALKLDLGSYSGPGQLNTNGALAIQAAGLFNNDGGDIHVSRLSFSAGALSNQGGQIVQTGASPLVVSVAGGIDNRGGTIANNGDLQVAAGSVINQAGSIRAAGGGSLVLTSDGLLDNRNQGDIGAGTDVSIRAGALQNDTGGSVTAAGRLNVDVAGAASNAGGTLAANGDTRIAAATLDNSAGKIGAVAGDLTVAIKGLTLNDKGQMQASGQTTLDTGEFANRQGVVSGNALALNTGDNALDNSGGTLVSATTLDLQSGRLANQGGLIQSGGAMTLDTHGQALDNSQAGAYVDGEGGIVSGGTLGLAAGAVDNTAGFIGGQDDVTARPGALTNVQGGVIQSAARLSLDTQGANVDNRGGKLQSIGDLSLDAAAGGNSHGGVVDNSGGLILSTGTTTVKAATLRNVDTQGSDQMGVGGMNVAVSADRIDNSRGAILANQSATLVSSGQILNAGGLVSAGDTLKVVDPLRTLTIDNTNGQLVAGRQVQIDAASFQGGRAASRQDLNITLTQDLVNNSELSADGNLTYVTSGNVTNNGKLSAGNTLTVGGGVVDNTASGVMTADTTIVNAGTLNNAGLIDGNRTQINAGLVENASTGRIYGDQLSVTAGTLNNSNGGTLAARQNLDIQAGTINNREHGYLFSMGDMTLGGGTLNNASAQVESLGNMTLNLGTINNTDSHFSVVRKDYGTTNLPGTLIPTGLGVEISPDSGIVLGYTDRSWAMFYEGQLRQGYGWTVMMRTDTVQRDEAGSAPDPGRIVAGGNMTINGMLHNRDSQVLAGGAMNIAPQNVDNTPTQGLEIVEHGGTYIHVPGVRGNNLEPGFLPVQQETHTINVGQGQVAGGQGATGGYRPPGQTAGGNGAPVDLAAAGGVVTGSASNPIIEVPSVVNGSGPLGGGSGAQAAGGAGAGAVAGNGVGAVGAGGATGAVAGPVANAGAAGASVASGGVSTAASDSASVGAGRNLNISMASIAPTIRNGVGLFGNSGALTAVGGVDAIDGRGAGGSAIAVGTVSGQSATAASGGAAASTGASGPSGTAASGSGPAVVRTSSPNTTLPNASLFQLQPDPGSRYLIATDSVFTRGAGFVSSDQLLGAFNGDLTLKRLGDGFYEQKLIREQIANLTGYRFLAGFSDDEAQYSALMNAGVTFAKQYGLTPGIALSAAQMAQLTSDIVWLVEQTVTLPDGSSQRVLVPQVYVRVQPGDIDGSGSLLSAGAMVIEGAGDLNNQGTIAGRTMVSIDAQNVNNLGGRIAGGSVAVNARNDLNNIGGSITAHDAAALTAGNDINIQTTTRSASGAGASITNIDRIAGVYVSNPGGTLIASAGNDVNLIGAALVSAGTVAVGAGHNVNLGTVTESSSRVVVGGTRFALAESQSREVGSAIVGQDNVRIAAGNDLNIRAGTVDSIDGALVASAGHDINLTAGQANASLGVLATSATKSRLKQSSTSNFDSTSATDVLSSSLSGNTVALVAGNDINAQAAQLRADGAMSLAAGRDVNLTTATQTTQEAHASQSKSSATGLGNAIGASTAMTGTGIGLIAGAAVTGSKSANGASAGTINEAVGTTVSAGSLQVVSGRDTTLQGATVVADGDITMVAGRNLTIESASNSSVQASSQSSSTSGMVGSWYNPSVGNMKSFDANAGTGMTQASSQVASLQGNVTLVAGETYRQTASSVLAAGQAGALVGGDVNILAKNVVINEAYSTEQTVGVTRGSSTILGGSASVGGISIDTIRNARDTVDAIGDTKDGRMKALGAVSLAMSGAQAYDTASTIASGGGVGFKVGVSVSRNKSESTNFSNSSVAVGSSIVGANNVNIIATGGGQDSNIHAVGSTIAAGNTLNLAADNAVTLEASRNTRESAAANSSSGASVGVSYAMGNQNGFTIELAASTGKGNANQNDVTYNNTHVGGGSAVNIVAGGDLTLKGAVVEANRVAADVGGNLNIESLQDVSVGQTHQSSSGVNASLCIPPICYGVSTVGGSTAKANTNGVYASVNEQSGIKAGDGGFDVNVKGNTDLKGGIVSSAQSAIDAGLNSLRTGTLTTSDLANLSTGSASSSGMSLDSDTLSQGKYGAVKTVIGNALNSGSAEASSIGATRAAVSGGAVVINDEVGQLALTGKTAVEVVASLDRDAATANVPAIRQNLEELEKEAKAQQTIKNAAFQQATAYSDEAYRRMFVENAPMAVIDRNSDGSIKYDESGRPMMHILTLEEKQNLQAGADGKIHVANNGIFNDLDAAAKYAAQHSTAEGGPQYFIYFPEANNIPSELMIAGYQRFMEGSTLGLTNATKETVDLMNQYGQSGLHLDGHSRGSMTIGNALQYMENQSNSGGLLSGTTINLFGPAFSVQQADQLLSSLQDRTSITDPQKLNDMVLNYQNHIADPIGALAGGNPGVGGAIPDGSSILMEALKAATGRPTTVHNCYGAGSEACRPLWGGGLPTFQPAKTYR